MALEVQRYLYDIQVAGELIQSFVAAQTFDSYRADTMLRSAVHHHWRSLEPGHPAIARSGAPNSRSPQNRRLSQSSDPQLRSRL